MSAMAMPSVSLRSPQLGRPRHDRGVKTRLAHRRPGRAPRPRKRASSRILLGLILFGPETKYACEIGKKARPVRGRFVRRAFQGKPRSGGLLPARRTEKPRVLEFFQIRQIAQRLESELE